MMFDKKVQNVLLEMPHIHFNTPSQLISFDFKIEKNRDYNSMLNRVRNYIATKGLSEDEKKIFYSEMRQTRNVFNNFLKRAYPNIFTNQINGDDILEKFIKDINY
jgi:hypothetical protein